jgi:hypothetical protein
VLRLVWSLVFSLAISMVARTSLADCIGPDACCITDPVRTTIPPPTHVRLGMRIMRIGSVDEQEGTYHAELTLLARWPAGGLRPDPKPRNGGADYGVALDETRLVEGQCYREERLDAAFRTHFWLQRFPFDSQRLRLNLEDRQYADGDLLYENDLWPNTISADAYREIGGWKIQDYPVLTQKHSTFAFPASAPHPRLLLVEIPVEREWMFYVTRYFLPLFLIVALAYCLFWIKPDDLGSAASIGITCVLAIIAFQLTQADHLPRVPYLTVADRVYVVCYAATGFAVLAAIREAFLVSNNRLDDAMALDRRWRKLFPALVIVAIAVSAVTGWRSDPTGSAPVPGELPPAVAPAGE